MPQITDESEKIDLTLNPVEILQLYSALFFVNSFQIYSDFSIVYNWFLGRPLDSK